MLAIYHHARHDNRAKWDVPGQHSPATHTAVFRLQGGYYSDAVEQRDYEYAAGYRPARHPVPATA